MNDRQVPVVDATGCVDLARELIAIPSPSGHEEEAADFIAERLARAGLDVMRVPPANVLVRVEGGSPGPRRLFLTHSDTMTAGAMESPFEAKVVAGPEVAAAEPALRGLGAAAPKSAVAAMITALEAVHRDRAQLSGTVQLAIVTKDLQANHAGVREVMASVDLDADWVVAGEPSGNRLVVGARGITQLRIDLQGRPAHWGRPADAANPLYGIGDILGQLRQLPLPSHAHLGKATVSPFEVSSEYAPPHSPHSASLRLDRRVLPGEDVNAIIEGFREVARSACDSTPGLSWTLTPERMMYPLEIDEAHPLVMGLSRHLAQVFEEDRPPRYITFSSNAGITATEKGWPSVGFGPGEITDLGPNEHVTVRQLHEASRAYAAMMTFDWP